MASNSVDTENGFTMIANSLLEAIIACSFTKSQYQVVLYVMRQTYGYKKKTDDMSYGQIAKATGIRRQHVIRAVKELVAINVLFVEGSGRFVQGGEINQIGINKHHDDWRSGPKNGREVVPNFAGSSTKNGTSPRIEVVPKSAESSPKNGREVVPKLGPTKEIQKKPKERGVARARPDGELPSDEKPKLSVDDLVADYEIPKHLASQFLQIRQDKKLTLTPKAMHDLVREYRKAGLSLVDGIELCATRSWAGFKASWNWQDGERNGTTSSGHNGKSKSATERFWERRAGQVFDHG